MAFQPTVNIYPSLGKEGAPASANPFTTALPPEGSYRAGASGVFAGRFGWRNTTNEQLIDNTGTGAPLGFLANESTGVLPVDSSGSMFVNANTPVTVATNGDFWVRTTTAATAGQKVFAVLADGTIKTDAAGATVAGAIETKWVVAPMGDAGDVGSLIKITSWE